MTRVVMNGLATVELSLEETGTICHLIMSSFVQSGIDPSQPIGPQIPEQPPGSLIGRDTIVATLQRGVALYDKMAEANSRLMRGPRP
jgi:hypothetical protein